jgi:transcriptional regulator with XRE-family HTH domain
MITPAQCRAARALLNWSQQQLAEAATVGNATIRNFESGNSAPQHSTLDVLRRALEAAGVIFVDENGEGPGVRLKKRSPGDAEITEKIQALDQKAAALKVEGKPSPEIGMNQLKKAFVLNERTKLKKRLAKIKGSKPK